MAEGGGLRGVGSLPPGRGGRNRRGTRICQKPPPSFPRTAAPLPLPDPGGWATALVCAPLDPGTDPHAGVGLCLLHLGPSTAHSTRLGAERAVGGATLTSQEPHRSPHPTPWSCHPVPSVIAEPGGPCNSNHSFPDRPQRTLPPVTQGCLQGTPSSHSPVHRVPPTEMHPVYSGDPCMFPVISLLCPLAALPRGCSCGVRRQWPRCGKNGAGKGSGRPKALHFPQKQ